MSYYTIIIFLYVKYKLIKYYMISKIKCMNLNFNIYSYTYPKLCGNTINCPIARVSIPCKAVQSFLSSLFKVLPGRSVESQVTTTGLASIGRVNLITKKNTNI